MNGPTEPDNDETLELSPGESVPIGDIEFDINKFGETVCLGTGSSVTDKEAVKAVGAPMPDRVGRYEIRGLLGQGGFGAVYEGFDSQLERAVAVKIPRLDGKHSSCQEDLDEMLREARRLAQLTHPSIVTVFDVGFENETCYIVSDLLKGDDLNNWLRERAVTWQESARIISSLAGALAAAHSVGIVHRDVKMDNILMTDRTEGTVPVLVDFGLAIGESEEPVKSSMRGVIAGTPNYMSPEQANGQGHRIDGRTDIYSLGVVMYRLLCGELPFRAKQLSELLQQVIHDEPRPPRQFVKGLPREVERICLKAMAKRISDRYTAALDMAEDLERLLKDDEGDLPTPVPVSIVQRAPKQRVETLRSTSSSVIKKDATPASPARPSGGLRILLAEDHEVTRFKLKHDLEKWGHYVVDAEDGQQAWEMFQEDEYSVVITDWMMPGMDGVELVQRIRGAKSADYVYIIMLTAKAEKHDIVAGMGAGADDFLAKPFHRDELNVRLRAGRRITELTHVLGDSNRRMKRSLEAAAKIQRSFLPTEIPEVAGIHFGWSYSPSDDLGGDMLNIVQLDDNQLGMYVLEVSGHGVPASLLSTTLCRELASCHAAHSLLLNRDEQTHETTVLEPVDVMKRLAQLFVSSKEAGQFITLIYGILDVSNREFRYASAGNPPVVLQSGSDVPELRYASGMPIGLTPDNADYEQETIQLSPGDRVFIYSDGMTDTQNTDGELFGSRRVVEAVQHGKESSVDGAVNELLQLLESWRAEAEVTDDISVLAFSVE